MRGKRNINYVWAPRIGMRAVTLVLLPLILSASLITLRTVEAQTVRKETLVKINILWLKVSVELPAELVATKEYSIPVTLRITEVEGSLKVFYLKGLRFSLDSGVLEYVPDTPVLLQLGSEETITVKLEPKFFASNMAPGDVKDASLRVDLSYYMEATDYNGRRIYESGYYSVFASIPVRVVAPRTYVYVQPSLNVTYEPYIVNFTVRIWVEGEGFVENAKMTVEGAPVQCYLLTTGKIKAGESRTLWTVMNVTELGPFARNRYTVTVSVTAVTPWGYTYTYSFPLALELKPTREAEVSAPSVAAAYALIPVSLILNPPPQKGEQVTVTVSWNGKRVYSGSYSRTLYLSLPEGEGELRVRVTSDLYTPATASARLKTVSVEPVVTAYMSESTVNFRAAPVYPGATIEVKVYGEDGSVVESFVVPVEALPRRTTNIKGAVATEAFGSRTLDLKPGKYTIAVTYATSMGAKAATLKYEVPITPTYVLLLILQNPLFLLPIIAGTGVAVTALVALRLRRRR